MYDSTYNYNTNRTNSKLEMDGNLQSLIQFYHKYRTNIILNKITEVTP